MKITIKIEATERAKGYERTFETDYCGYIERLKEALNLVVDWYEMLAEKESK